MHKTFPIPTTCAALAGCSSVGTVNGVPMNHTDDTECWAVPINALLGRQV